MAFVLYRENRSAFRIVVPVVILALTLYLIAFWNQPGSLGFAARAIKSQFAPQQASLRDQQSDQYRRIENYDIYQTIRQAPLTGVGFGKPFSMVVPLPDISFFVWYQYITHNSIGWIWMKTGIGGFVAMLFLIGLAIMNGMQVLFRIPDWTMRAVVLTAVLYILMYFTYAYVDMSWDSKSMVYMGAMMGIISCAEKIVTRDASSGPGVECFEN
jgi:O-antigen ligase